MMHFFLDLQLTKITLKVALAIFIAVAGAVISSIAQNLYFKSRDE
jgi:hypothetical protein